MTDLQGWDDMTPDPALIVADGVSVTVNVYKEMLVIKDGPADDARERRYAKVPRKVKHVVIFSPHGYVSTGAMRWMHDVGITWAVIDRSGKQPRTVGLSGGTVNASLMRRQAYAARGGPLEAIGIEIIRCFLTGKLQGQAFNARYLLGNPAQSDAIEAQLAALQRMDSLSRLGGTEGLAAREYWQAWKDLPVQWSYPQPIKPHWVKYPGRPSLARADSNRRASDPVNSMLNFGYHLAETECILALQAAGLSPDMGIAHTDVQGRASFALDLIEVMRPKVDEVVLNIASERMDKRWFSEDAEGVVRVVAPLSHKLAAEIRSERVAGHLIPDVRNTVTMLNKMDGGA
jgi:CRISPR-associated endonuclease Cas1